jgi:hypothetical protein
MGILENAGKKEEGRRRKEEGGRKKERKDARTQGRKDGKMERCERELV